jgi:hypothetical protein
MYQRLEISAAITEDGEHLKDLELDPQTLDADYEVITQAQAGTAASPTTVDSSQYSDYQNVLIQNRDHVYSIYVTWDDNDANSNTHKVPPRGFLGLPDVDPATDPEFVAEGDADDIYFALWGLAD